MCKELTIPKKTEKQYKVDTNTVIVQRKEKTILNQNGKKDSA